jgi:hypothetical protein
MHLKYLVAMHVQSSFTLPCAEARGLRREGLNRTSLVAALESLAHRPSMDGPSHGSVSLELEDINAVELKVLCKTLTLCGPAVGKVRLERSRLEPTSTIFAEALQYCTHISRLR